MRFKSQLQILFSLALLCSTSIAFETEDSDSPDWDAVSLHPNGMPVKNVTIMDYQVRDQCQRGVDQSVIKSYGLKFRLHKKHKKQLESDEYEDPFDQHESTACADGFFLCYESQLDKRSTKTGMIPAIPYRVPNKRATVNNVTKKCEEMRENFLNAKEEEFLKEHNNITDVEFQLRKEEPGWHGIFVYTVGNHIFLELSITNQIYDLGEHDEFSLLFGTPQQFYTKVMTTTETGHPIHVKFPQDEHLLHQFLKKYPSGAPLRKFASLWMLGLDVLPGEATNEFQLHSALGKCYCDMHVWFLRPTDEDEPEMPEKAPKSGAGCEQEQPQIPTIPPNPMPIPTMDPSDSAIPGYIVTSRPGNRPKRSGSDHRYIVLGEIGENDPKVLGLSLCAPSERGKACWLRMNVTQGRVDVVTKIDGQVRSEHFEKSFQILNNTRVSINIFVRHYYVEFNLEFAYNEPKPIKIKFKHWPNFWYETFSFDGIDDLHYEQSGDWKVIKFEDHKDAKWPAEKAMFPINVPWSSRRFPKEFTVQSNITIRGFVPTNASKFHIAMLRNAPEANEWIGQTIFNLTFDFKTHSIYLATFMLEGLKLKSMDYHQLAQESVVTPGIHFEAVMIAGKLFGIGSFVLHLFSSLGNQMVQFGIIRPFWSITHLNIGGDVQLFEMPRLFFAPVESVNENVLALVPPLDVGDIISMQIYPVAESTEFSVWLLAGAKEYDRYIGNTPLRVSFQYNHDSGDVLMMSTKIDNCCKLKSPVLGQKNKVTADDSSDLFITVKENAFAVNVSKREVGSYAFAKSGFTPWSVDHVMITGGPFQVSPSIEVIRKPKAPLELPYIMVLNESLAFGGHIDVVGTTSGHFGSIGVYLLHDALRLDPNVGQTVLLISIVPEKMQLTAYFGKQFQGGSQVKFASPLGPNQSFTLQINVQKSEYKIVLLLDDNKTEIGHFPHQLPIWAVQYVRIEGDLALAQHPRIVEK